MFSECWCVSDRPSAIGYPPSTPTRSFWIVDSITADQPLADAGASANLVQ